ncbi:hypothetical protein KIW84_013267 [Lathyrus oleraceus]|uniref:Uncharacterized protein n=1 Tax=Pisum sativum TaxID=3888 RepID=A0A9D5BJY7_PEA|nr:hypothetical protein KIW84_013267 [Pisum sativum]
MEGIPELTLNTHVDELMVLCETTVDFENVKENGFDFFDTLAFQGWNSFFERLKGLVYPVLVKQFWVHATMVKETITAYVMNRKIVITENSIIDLISHNGKGKRVHNVKTNVKREANITFVIFKAGINLDDDKGPKVYNKALKLFMKNL